MGDDLREYARKHRRGLGRRACRHLATFVPCRPCQRERRAVQRELDQLWPRDAVQRDPETFGLLEDELRAEANRLAELGWRLEEIESVLAVTRRAA